MNDSYLISVIIPIYNTSQYLDKCIKSIICDNFNIEIILINDGSTDCSLDICKSYLHNENIVLIDWENRCLSKSRNKGIEIARGKYIVFVDSDDYVSKDYFKVILEAINSDDFDIAIFGYYINYEEKTKIEKSPLQFKCLEKASAKSVQKIYESNFFNLSWNKVYKKSIIFDNMLKYTDGSVPCEDFIFNCHYFKYVNQIRIIKKSLYNYMKHENEITLVNKFHPNLLDTVQFAISEYDKLLDNYTDKNDQQIKFLTYQYLFPCIPNVFKGSKNQFKDFKRVLTEMKKHDVFSIENHGDCNFFILKTFSKFSDFFCYMIYFVIVHIYWAWKGKKR